MLLMLYALTLSIVLRRRLPRRGAALRSQVDSELDSGLKLIEAVH